MNRVAILMGLSLLGLVLIFASLSRNVTHSDAMSDGKGGAKTEPLVLHCAASNRAVMEAIRRDYEQEFETEVQIQYGPSQTLLSAIEVSQIGDLYLPADDSYLDLGKQKGLIAEAIPIARMQAGIAIRKQDSNSIKKLQDLFRNDVRFVIANPDTAAIGKVTRQVLSKSGTWNEMEQAASAQRATVNEVANDVAIGAVDAGIVYNAVLHTYPDLAFVNAPELAAASSEIAIGVVASTQQPTRALHFARYVSAADRGLKRYREYGFGVADREITDGDTAERDTPNDNIAGDTWSDQPELSIFAGSMLRPAINETINAFEKREGVTVNRVFNGCGILVAQMKSGQHPDAYFACDSEFMNQVHDLFPEPIPVTQNELVILVQKGNPKGIASLKDLANEGIRVGIGHEKQCAMGWITQNTFREGGVQSEVMSNVTVQTPTGDMLVNQLQTGSLDAAVAYLSNAAGASEFLDAIRIKGIECSVATQPWAVSKESKSPQLASRLFRQICSAQSQETFAAEGFRWRVGLDETPSVVAQEDSSDSDAPDSDSSRDD